MKKFSIFLSTLLLGSLFLISVSAASPVPQVDTPTSPVDANKAIISGTTEPGAKVIITGGPFNIPTNTADKDGHFEVEVGLAQEMTNNFFVQAQLTGEDPSEAVQVIIVESASLAAEHETSTGEDRTAPDPPAINNTNVETDEITHSITGTTEPNITISVTGAFEGSVNTDSLGNFAITVGLSGGNIEDAFTVSAIDTAGNISSGVRVYVTSTAEQLGGQDIGDLVLGGQDIGDMQLGGQEVGEIFSDILGHWAYDYILRLFDLDVVQGYDDGRFAPEDPVTRAQVLKMALLSFGHDTSNFEDVKRFLDISSSDWFNQFVLYSFENEIVEGFADNTFRPDNPVSRAAALKIILKAADVRGLLEVTPNFDDVDAVNDWFAIYTAWALENGIVSGYEDGGYHPDQNISRAEVAKIILEVKDFIEATP